MASSDDGPLNTKKVGAWLKYRIDNYKKHNGIEILAVESKSTFEFMGYCGLTQYPDISGSTEFEIGYRFIRKYWGYGYAT